MTTPFLAGENILLRPLDDADADGPYPGWLNDPLVSQGNSHHVYPYTREQARAFIRGLAGDRSQVVLAITMRPDGRHVGNTALQDIHPVNRTAELAILLGDRSVWGKGVGTAACRLLVEHGFFTLNLHRIGCATFSNNVGMQKIAEHLGMKKEGVRRQAAFKDGEWVDVVEFGLLRSEYEKAR